MEKNANINAELAKVSIDHAAAERITTNGTDPLQLKQEILAIRADQDEQYFSDVFANDDVATTGSFDAGSWTFRRKERAGITHDRVAGTTIADATKVVVKEVIMYADSEKYTLPEYFLPEELAMAGVEAVANQITLGQLQTIRNELETQSLDAMVSSAQTTGGDHYTTDWNFTSMTGEEILEDITAKADILIGGDKTNKVKQRYNVNEISTLVNEKVWRKLALILSVMNTGSAVQAEMLLKNTIPQGMVGGLVITQAPSSVMGADYPVIMGTNGSYGSLLKRRRNRVFIEAPTRRGGEMEAYITYRSANKVVLPETIFVFTTLPSAKSKKTETK